MEMNQLLNFIFSGRRKIHFTFSDGSELAEEYDMRSDELLGKHLK